MRIEDVDTPRTRAGASDAILRTLATYGFEWDGAVVRQSERTALYQAALDDLIARGLAFPCGVHAQGTRTRTARDRRRTRLSGNLSQRDDVPAVPAARGALRVGDEAHRLHRSSSGLPGATLVARRWRFRDQARRRTLRLPAGGSRRRRGSELLPTSFAARICSRRRRDRSGCRNNCGCRHRLISIIPS